MLWQKKPEVFPSYIAERSECRVFLQVDSKMWEREETPPEGADIGFKKKKAGGFLLSPVTEYHRRGGA